MHNKIKKLSCKRMLHLMEGSNPFYKGHETFLKGIEDELKEVKEEIKENNSVHLEDELGDVFWDFMCLMYSLKNEGKISSVDKVFERSFKKFSTRLKEDGSENGIWSEIKKKQKEKLKIEHNRLYNNDK